MLPRPRKTDERTERIAVRVTDAEKSTIQDAARRDRRSTSDFVRAAALDRAEYLLEKDAEAYDTP